MKMPKVGQEPSLPVVAMADIAFLLLVFFMVTSSMDQNRKLKIDVPVAKNTVTVPQEQVFSVYVDKDGLIVFKGRVIRATELDFLFLKHRMAFKDPIVQIIADKEVNYKTVDEVLQIIRKKTAVRVAFTCKEEK